MEEKDKQRPLISIVIPTYNQKPEFLSQCIESVLQQTYRDIVIIISDNHSTNGISTIIDAYAAKDNRIIAVKPPQHLSLVDNFAFAATQVKTAYLSFLSSDDWVCPDWLENMMPAVTSNDVNWAYGEVEAVDITLQKVNYVYRRGRLPTGIYTAKESFSRFVTLEECGWMLGDIIKTSAYFEAGGIVHEGISFCADLSLAFKLHESGNVYYLNKIVGRNRQWYFRDGKVDSQRSVKEISDFVNIYGIAEKSEKLLSYLPQGLQTINKWKKYYALRFARILIVDLATGTVTPAERKDAATNILKLNDSPGVRTSLVICSNRWICSVFYKFYKRFRP